MKRLQPWERGKKERAVKKLGEALKSEGKRKELIFNGVTTSPPRYRGKNSSCPRRPRAGLDEKTTSALPRRTERKLATKGLEHFRQGAKSL